MGEIATAFVRIRPNMAGFRSETQAGVRGAFMGVGKLVGGIFAGVLGAEAVKGAVEAASSIQKQVEVIRFEFGRAGESLIHFADTTGVALGDANRYTDEASARFGLLFKSLGVGKTQAAAMTIGFEKLALSVNAIRGGGAQGAHTLLQQIVLAAAGNTRGLKQMGIVVDATSEKIAAFKLGLINNMTQALTPSQKTQAIYAIATAHLGETMALAKKHAGDLANVQARLSAEWMLAKERIGVALMPAVVRLLNFLSSSIPRTVSIIMRVFGDLKTSIVVAFSAIRPVFAPIVAGVRAVFDAFQGGGGITGALDRIKQKFLGLSAPMKAFAVAVTATFAVLAVTMLGPISAILAIGVAFGEAYKRSAAFRSLVGRIGDFIRAKLLPPIREFATLAVNAFSRVINYIEAHKSTFVKIGIGLAAALAVLISPIGAVVAALVILYKRSDTVRRIMTTAFNAIRSVVVTLIPIFSQIGSAVAQGLASAAPLLHNFANTVRVVFVDAMQVIRPFARFIAVVVVGAVRVLAFAWRHFGGTVIAAIKATFAIVVGTIKAALEIIRGIFDVFAGVFTGDWSKAWKGVKEIFGGILHGMVNLFKNWGKVVIQFFTDLWHTIEKIVLEGIEKVVHLLAKIPTGFTVFGQHFGFTNPFQAWDKSLKGTIASVGKTGKAASAAATQAARKTGSAVASANANAIAASTDAAKKKAIASTNDPAYKKSLGDVGKNAINAVNQGAASAALSAAQKQAIGLGKTLNDTMQRAIQAANAKIASTIQSAKNNLDKIGGDLAKSIEQIQAKMGGAAGALAGSPQGKAFQKLKKLIESGAPSFEIARARASMESQLQNVGKTQAGTQSVVRQQLADLTGAFNRGKVGYREFERRLHEILQRNGITMREALKVGGSAFANTMRAQIRALGQQAQAISQIPAKYRNIGGAGGAADIKIIRPLEVIRAEQMRVAVVAQKQRDAQLKAQQKTNALLTDIKNQKVGPLPGFGKTPRGHRGHAARRHARTGGR